MSRVVLESEAWHHEDIDAEIIGNAMPFSAGTMTLDDISLTSVSPVRTLTLSLEPGFRAKGRVVFEDGSELSFVSDAKLHRIKFRTVPMKPALSSGEERQREALSGVIKSAIDGLRRANA